MNSHSAVLRLKFALDRVPSIVVFSLQALIPLCDDDNQSMEIIQRLQKNLDILIQAMTRVSSRSEMLGAIHQVRKSTLCLHVLLCDTPDFMVPPCLTVRRVASVKQWR